MEAFSFATSSALTKLHVHVRMYDALFSCSVHLILKSDT